MAVETLLVCCGAKDPWSCNALQLDTRQSVWSCKGQEWEGMTIQHTALINQQYMAVALKDKPVLSMISVNTQDRKHVRSILPSPCRILAVSDDGSLLSASLANAPEMIYTWNVPTGRLLSIVSGHFQCINQLKFAEGLTFLVSGGADGQVCVWLVSDLMISGDSSVHKVTPFRKWSSHGLAVRGMHVTNGGGDVRVVSCSMDHTVNIHSIAADQCLATILVDAAVTCCTIDNADTRLFIAVSNATICCINLFMQPALRERQVSTVGDSTQHNPLMKGHSSAVTCMAVNMDGSVLASGDQSGCVKLWHTLSHQCLHTLQQKGAVCTLIMSLRWPSLQDPRLRPTHPVAVLQKQIDKKPATQIPIVVGRNASLKHVHLRDLIFKKTITSVIEATSSHKMKEEKPLTNLEKKKRKRLIEKNGGKEAKLKRANQELYHFMVDKVLNSDK